MSDKDCDYAGGHQTIDSSYNFRGSMMPMCLAYYTVSGIGTRTRLATHRPRSAIPSCTNSDVNDGDGSRHSWGHRWPAMPFQGAYSLTVTLTDNLSIQRRTTGTDQTLPRKLWGLATCQHRGSASACRWTLVWTSMPLHSRAPVAK